ncbi:MAG: CehA/McbA family metallohydrolase [Verrucomicrobiales bacterium]|nr:CehA/McbA family metallohydrolase [Verrucomicrobiales bacterium]
MKKALTCLFCWISLTFYICAKPEAFEVNNALFNELPGGKEADAIVGDFILRNDKVEAVISQNAPFRKANMGTFWGASGTTQGCLYDLDLKGADNDQITIFAPLGLRGGVSYVRVAEGRPDGESAIETVITAAKGAGMYTKHLYRIRDGWSGVLITTLLRNETKLDRKVKLNDSWTRFGSEGSAGDIRWADSVDPADGRGYAYRWDWKDGKKPGEITLKAGQEITVERFLAVGSSPLSAVGEILKRSGNTGTLSGKVIAADNEKVSGVEIVTEVNGGTVSGYTESDGSFSFSLPKGQAYELSFKDTGRATKTETFDLKSGDSLQKDIRLPSQSAVVFNIKDGNEISIPCKVQFNGSGKTKAPNLGPNNRAHGCVDQYQSERGDFRVPVPSGTYRIVVTHGIEFSHIEREVTVGPGQSVSFEGVLKRVVDTTGWVSTDYHNHSTPSGDNTCGTADRVINMAAEQLEFVPTTEHNRLFDWTPTIASLGLESFMSTVPGIELTGSGAHFNAFPYKPDPRKQDGGAPQWSKDPRLTAITLRHLQDSDPDRWVHINHPSMEENFVDWNGDGLIDGGYANLGSMMDGLETQNYLGNNILAGAPYRIEKKLGPGGRVKYIREFIWLQILNQGHRVWGIAVSDAHTVHGNGAGGWLTYVKSSTDDPPKIDWRELVRNSKSGQMILTNGPYLEVNASGGVLAGGDLRASGGEVNMKIKVQCTDWIDIDRVEVLVNGHQREDLNFTRKDNKAMFLDGTVKFDQEIKVKLNQDAHLIVVAYGEGFNLSKGYGSSTQSAMNPCAYNNPIFVDVDGGGFKPNGDTLGYPLPVKGLTADKVAELLKK